ncbi:hypothetical protein D5086_028274 [Populus alba]|uniref:Uncharacterized protein n=1 Tax=Populus alba TaxID=43335 RepID=A0ACC4AXU0_POPAL
MTKSKTKSSILRSTQGDFRFQTNCHAFASCTPRVHSRSCSPVQYGFISPSPTSTPPRTKVVFANFVDFSSLARVSSKRKYKTMQKNGFLAQSLHPPSSGGCNGRSYSCSRTSPLPTKRLVEYNPSGSCLGLGGLNPTLSIVSPSQPSFGKSHPSSFPSGVTPSPIGATSFASPVKDKSLPGYSRDLKENQLDFTFSEEEYEKYSPSSPAPAIPVILASPKGANLDPSKTENVGIVFTRLSPPVDAPTVPTVPSVAQDEQQCNQATSIGSKGWETVRKRKNGNGNKHHSPSSKTLPVESSQPP